MAREARGAPRVFHVPRLFLEGNGCARGPATSEAAPEQAIPVGPALIQVQTPACCAGSGAGVALAF